MTDREGGPPPDNRPVSLAMVAATAGVSISTVSRIVNGETRRASAETVQRVREAVEATGYRPNSIGRTLRSGESRLVAMLVARSRQPRHGDHRGLHGGGAADSGLHHDPLRHP
ncbi:LacI family DNA-binding transcriptional regulator (plasmid) [Roseomonas mucosa]|nr:LacI family DNA-binding transcriptional regulator [Roseomonas mucosa]